MKARPILFATDMVRALLDGRKTQTRRIIKEKDLRAFGQVASPFEGTKMLIWDGKLKCPYGEPGDLLWVREAFLYRNSGKLTVSRADLDSIEAAGFGAMYGGWKPSIHMPRWASRLTLEITGVRVERLQDISEDDAIKEGIVNPPNKGGDYVTHIGLFNNRHAFAMLWESINGKDSWDDNPWVWVIEFHAIKGNVDRMFKCQ